MTKRVSRVRVEIPRDVLKSVFEECDRYDRVETGGRMIGHYAVDDEELVIRASGVIEPGPRARRTSTSFFQDGDHQTRVFRQLEAQDPSIEHLGSWHTHHVNGYPTLSAGDKATYRRIVNHDKHNLDFFYALLVTHREAGRTGLDRYTVRHYVLFRGDDAVYEIEPGNVRITDRPSIRPTEHPDADRLRDEEAPEGRETPASVAVRARDQVVLGVLFPSLEPRLSTVSGTFFWRGPMSLIDGSAIDVRVAEVRDEQELSYYPVVEPTSERVAELCGMPFPSAAHAVRALESQMNREIYQAATTR